MRIIPFLIGAILTIALIVVLDRKWGAIPPVGRFLSPQQGFWQNAEAVGRDQNESIRVPGVKGRVEVHLDERLVPHVFAENDEDAYFVQGYLHAKYRLWQMEMQTYAAAGRLSEKIGPNLLAYDRQQRREGMVWAAEKALAAFEADPQTKLACDAYTAGVNAYINTLSESVLPLEYKLLDFRPEPWSNLKTALFLKQMSRTLAGYDTDLENTTTKKIWTYEDLLELDPQVPDSLIAIAPKGTVYPAPGVVPIKPADADSLYFEKKDSVQALPLTKPDPLNGSNNWVVSPSKTQSGAPILCNDPHLELSFPSIWYEMQLTTPNMNVYGATFPGTPSVIIGFNDNIAWGVTNAQRDVRDYYEIRFKDDSRQEYWYNGQWEKATLRVDTIRRRGAADYLDTTAYTVWGPVTYDRSFLSRDSSGRALALRWTAHDASNEGLTFYKLNRAKTYDDYLDAIRTFTTPGQNFVFASRTGDIALWQQGRFPARWSGQGVYVMPGTDTSYRWQGFIPQGENPHGLNPAEGFLQSANQRPADSTYPYFIPGNYINARGVTIYRKLEAMNGITTQDMMKLQNDTYSSFAEGARNILLTYVADSVLNADERRYVDLVRNWDLYASANSTGATVFQAWFDSLETRIWRDEWSRGGVVLPLPDEQTLLEALNRDSAFRYVDDVNTADTETLQQQVTTALRKAVPALKEEEAAGRLAWAAHKQPMIYHLLKENLPAFARPIAVGGWSNTIQATTKSHGPSWRMIVQLSSPTEAWGVYPGGQSGNPGSPFYDNFVDTWAAGKYYPLWLMKAGEKSDKRIKATITFTHS